MDNLKKAYDLLNEWKGESFIHGLDVLDQVGKAVSAFGKKALVVANKRPVTETVLNSLKKEGVELASGNVVPSAKPNSHREDVYRITSYLLQYKPDCIVAIGGGSTIDVCKAANVLATLGKDFTPEVDYYLGTGIVTESLKQSNNKLIPFVAVQTSASSGSHLSKYANVTDPLVGQKKLIVDPAIEPNVAVFDYKTTVSLSTTVTIDGIFDSIAHTFEVFCGAKENNYKLTAEIAKTAMALILEYSKKLIDNPTDLQAREAIGLASDLGGYAIMVGGTSGGHLTSFSLVDLVGHGTACGIMNPYYFVFYNKAIEPQLREMAPIFKEYGFLKQDVTNLNSRQLAEAVANAMIDFAKSINAPTKLSDIPGFSEKYIKQALVAAKDPQLKMKLQNMPVPLTSEQVDEYMEPILRAATNGDMSLIKEM